MVCTFNMCMLKIFQLFPKNIYNKYNNGLDCLFNLLTTVINGYGLHAINMGRLHSDDCVRNNSNCKRNTIFPEWQR
jgi:hypothetical protein